LSFSIQIVGLARDLVMEESPQIWQARWSGREASHYCSQEQFSFWGNQAPFNLMQCLFKQQEATKHGVCHCGSKLCKQNLNSSMFFIGILPSIRAVLQI
jgi:hypothetical protein